MFGCYQSLDRSLTEPFMKKIFDFIRSFFRYDLGIYMYLLQLIGTNDSCSKSELLCDWFRSLKLHVLRIQGLEPGTSRHPIFAQLKAEQLLQYSPNGTLQRKAMRNVPNYPNSDKKFNSEQQVVVVVGPKTQTSS